MEYRINDTYFQERTLECFPYTPVSACLDNDFDVESEQIFLSNHTRTLSAVRRISPLMSGRAARQGSFGEAFMRILALTAMLCLLCLPGAGRAQDKAAAKPEAAKAEAKLPTAEQSATMAKAARDKAEALEQARDRRVRQISKGICTGC
jgi:hypothetical protein